MIPRENSDGLMIMPSKRLAVSLSERTAASIAEKRGAMSSRQRPMRTVATGFHHGLRYNQIAANSTPAPQTAPNT
jgi:hypothetical protein